MKSFLTPDAYIQNLTLKQAQSELASIRARFAESEKKNRLLRQALEQARVQAVSDAQLISTLKLSGAE